jgi:DNA-binding PadR family transcriptional regulator
MAQILQFQFEAVHKRLFIALSDLAILIALKNHAMTGYQINNHLIKKLRIIVSPTTVYSTLASMERKGWIKCIKSRQGRVYVLTEEGRKIVEIIDKIIEESKRFIEKLLT